MGKVVCRGMGIYFPKSGRKGRFLPNATPDAPQASAMTTAKDVLTNLKHQGTLSMVEFHNEGTTATHTNSAYVSGDHAPHVPALSEEPWKKDIMETNKRIDKLSDRLDKQDSKLDKILGAPTGPSKSKTPRAEN